MSGYFFRTFYCVHWTRWFFLQCSWHNLITILFAICFKKFLNMTQWTTARFGTITAVLNSLSEHFDYWEGYAWSNSSTSKKVIRTSSPIDTIRFLSMGCRLQHPFSCTHDSDRCTWAWRVQIFCPIKIQNCPVEKRIGTWLGPVRGYDPNEYDILLSSTIISFLRANLNQE